MKFFRAWEIAAPAVFLPLAYVLWLRRFDGDHLLTLAAVQIPVLFAYVIPGIGTNVLGLWEIRGRWRLGRFRPHHGFVFGSAASLMAVVALPEAAAGLGLWQVGRSAFVVGSVFAFWNWLYDTYAVKAGFLVVYNRPHYEQAGPEAIATDYAPVFFGSFGAVYGASLELLRYYLVARGRPELYGWLLVATNLLVLAVPVAAFAALSRWRHGSCGLRPYRGGEESRAAT